MTERSFLDRGPEDLTLLLLEHARADSAPAGARTRALAKVTLAATAGAAVASSVHGAAAASLGKAVAVTTPLWVMAKWTAIGALSAVAVLGVEEVSTRFGTS